MLAVKMIRWSPFFTGLSDEQIAHITRAAKEIEVGTDHVFFNEGDELDTFYLVQEGKVDITINIPERDQVHSYVDQITRNMSMEAITVSTIGVGDVFGWSALIPPHESTANAIAANYCRVIAVDCENLRSIFKQDCEFHNLMVIKAAQTVRSRMRDLRIESLSFVA